MKEFRRLDLNSDEMGVPVSRLMDTAGRKLAAAAAAMTEGPIVFVCGKGNNGGDGYAAAVHLIRKGRDARCIVVEPPSGPESRQYFEALTEERLLGFEDEVKGRAPRGLVVDCLLGSGLTGDPRGPYPAVIRWINRQKAPVLACDVPSGLGTKIAVKPDRTLTFHARKEGMDEKSCGDIAVASIGIPRRAATDIGVGDLQVGYPVPGDDAHKGDNGHLLIVGGGPFTGAPYYAGMAAYRAGVDLVSVYAPEDAAFLIQSWGPDILVHASGPGYQFTTMHNESLGPALDRASAVLVGPGMGTDLETRDAIRELLDEVAARDLPVVVDADGLDAVTPEWLERHGRNVVLTPHGREFQDLAGRDATESAVQAYAKRHGVTVLRKAKVDVVTDGARKRLCHRGHPTMSVGGTGDVLAGIVGALIAKGAAPFDAACAAAYISGVAGETAARTFSYGATASDVIEAVPSVLHRL